MSMAAGTNFVPMPGHIAVLPVMFPWQQPVQAPHFTPQHNTLGDGQDKSEHLKKMKKREPWYRKFKYRYINLRLWMIFH